MSFFHRLFLSSLFFFLTFNLFLLEKRSHSALYSIFIYLQDTTHDMGVTGLCLGTHMCNGLENVQCIKPSMPSGTGLIINSQLYHQGSGNYAFDKKDGTRVMYIITFATRPSDSDPRVLPLGSIYGKCH